MTSLCRSGGSGDGGGGGSGGGGGRPSSRCGAVRWGAPGGGQQRQRESLTPQQLREWCTSRGGGGRSSDSHSAAVQLGVPGGGLTHLQRRPPETLTPQQLREWYVQRGASLSSTRCPYVIRTATVALGASASGTPPGTAPAEALHTFTLESGASRCFFRDSTTLTPLPAPVPVRLGDPSGGPVVAHSSTALPCPAVPSGSLSGLHLPSFSTNLVSTAALQDAMVTTTTPGGQRVSICTCTRTGHHLATFTRRPGSSLYTLATEPPQVAASAQMSASGQVAASCSCRLLTHQNLLWHHRLGHPLLPRLRGMHSRLLVSGLPRSLPPLPPSPAPPCLPCVEGRQRAAPHSSSFPSTTAPLQTLHMDVWGPARVSGQGRERYFLLVVDDYTRYTTVFPLRSKGEVSAVLIPWIRTVRLQMRERFGQDLPVLRLHSDRGGDFSSDLLRDFCRGEGIRQSFTLPDSPQQNRIAERRIGLVMEVARTSMIHAAAPHFLWPFAVRYAAHQLNLWPRVSLPETSPTLRWTGKVSDVSVFRVWGSRAFVRDTSADKLSARAIPCVFLGFVPDAPGWQFFHPTSHRVLPSQDVTFDESVPFYRLFPYRSAPPGPAPSEVSQVDPLPGTAPVQAAVVSGGAEPGGAGSEGAGSGGAEPEGVEPGGAESEGAESGGAEPRGAASSGGPVGASPCNGGGGSGGSGGGSGGFGGGGGGSCGGGGSDSGGSGGGWTGAQRGGSRGGQRQQQQRRSDTPSPQQLREWFAQRGASGDSVSCPYVLSMGDRAGQTCGKPHTQRRCFSRLDDAWRAELGDEAERPGWAELLRSGVAIFDIDYDAILATMYALSVSAEGASESVLPDTAPAEALHTFTLDSGASRCFFHDSTILTPLPSPVPIRLADPSTGPVLARSSTVLLCPAVPSGSLSGLHLPSFSTKLVSTVALQDAMVTTTTPRGQRALICTCTRTCRHLATFTRRPGSSMYTLATEPPQVAASAQVSASAQVAPPCSCRLLSHHTLLWHHRLGHPSLPCLRGMHSCLLVSGLPRSLPPSHPRPPRPAFLVSRAGSAPLLTPPRFPRRLLTKE
ncbi:unnamed protein product [Closterium sp. NIES-54]